MAESRAMRRFEEWRTVRLGAMSSGIPPVSGICMPIAYE